VNGDWVVLLIGGASGVGKSSMSHRLARLLDANLTELDDISIAMRAATTPEQQPLLHFWETDLAEFLSWTDDQRAEHHLRVCREVYHPVIEAVIADHLETGIRVVYEGDYFTPELIARIGDQRVQGLFVSEPDEAQIRANLTGREGEVEPERIRTCRVLDERFRAECALVGVPVVDARPWADVLERALALTSPQTVEDETAGGGAGADPLGP